MTASSRKDLSIKAGDIDAALAELIKGNDALGRALKNVNTVLDNKQDEDLQKKTVNFLQGIVNGFSNKFQGKHSLIKKAREEKVSEEKIPEYVIRSIIAEMNTLKLPAEIVANLQKEMVDFFNAFATAAIANPKKYPEVDVFGDDKNKLKSFKETLQAEWQKQNPIIASQADKKEEKKQEVKKGPPPLPSFPPPPLPEQTQTLIAKGDGNCAFNAFALAIFKQPAILKIVEKQLLEESKDDFAEIVLKNLSPGKRKTFGLNDDSTWPDFKEKLLKLSADQLQEALAPGLRVLAINLIESEPLGASHHYDATLNILLADFDQLKKGKEMNDDILPRHKFIIDKLTELKEAKDSEKVLSAWWRKEGHKKFLDEMKKNADTSADTNLYAGDLELKPLADFFKVDIAIHSRRFEQPQMIRARENNPQPPIISLENNNANHWNVGEQKIEKKAEKKVITISTGDDMKSDVTAPGTEKSFFEKIKEIEAEISDWKVAGRGTGNFHRVTKGTSSFDIYEKKITTKDQEVETFTAILKTFKAAHPGRLPEIKLDGASADKKTAVEEKWKQACVAAGFQKEKFGLIFNKEPIPDKKKSIKSEDSILEVDNNPTKHKPK